MEEKKQKKKKIHIFDLNDYVVSATVKNNQLKVTFNFPIPSNDTRDLRNKYNTILSIEEK